MLTITITGETPEDVKNQLQAFDKALTPGAKAAKADSEEEPKKKVTKVTKATEDDEEPNKKPVKKVVEEEAEDKVPTHEDARAAIIDLSKKLEWDPAPPKIQAFTKKFAKKHDLTEDDGETHISRIPQIPVKKLKLFLEAIKEEGEI